LGPEALERYPHEFSGGQRQRIAIARAIALRPRLVVCDEPTSALDVSVQSQVVNLLKEVQAEFGMAYLFISHNLDLVYHMADRILVMYLGNVMEEGDADSVFLHAKHPYTKALMDSIPSWDPDTPRMFRSALGGEPPSPVNVPAGCPFHPRCPLAVDRCRSEKPALRTVGSAELPDHKVACHLA
jgi:oligopeptide/dipeptide ABC transporter ATP-binding protein